MKGFLVSLFSFDFILMTDINVELLNSPDTGLDDSNTGFGKIFPKPNLNITEEVKDDSDEMPSECISRRELEKGRISREGNIMT